MNVYISKFYIFSSINFFSFIKIHMNEFSSFNLKTATHRTSLQLINLSNEMCPYILVEHNNINIIVGYLFNYL